MFVNPASSRVFGMVIQQKTIRSKEFKPGKLMHRILSFVEKLVRSTFQHRSNYFTKCSNPRFATNNRAAFQRIATEGSSSITAAVMDGQALDLTDYSFEAEVADIFGLIFFPDRARWVPCATTQAEFPYPILITIVVGKGFFGFNSLQICYPRSPRKFCIALADAGAYGMRGPDRAPRNPCHGH